jgi:formamidopyrimidine-DNA glycosylase
MPELPEVEVTRRRIEPVLVGRTVRSLRTTAPSYFFLTPPDRLRRLLRGRTVTALHRHGKYLILSLDDEARLVMHLGMTGQLFAAGTRSVRLLSATARAALAPEEQSDFRPDAHTHLVFRFKDDGPEVIFRDVRKFGKVLWVGPDERPERLSRLGVDALEVTGDHLFRATRRRKIAIKTLLLGQQVVAGVGNIYADEALFGAGVRPRRRAGRVTRAECDRIARALRRVMARSIATGGSSISDFVAPDGRDGAYQDERRVYARAGQPCPACGAAIARIVVGARGTHYCPRCQR